MARKNHWTKEDKLLAGVAAVTVVGLAAVVYQRKQQAETIAGLRGLRGLGLGLGAYFQDPVNIPISGLGSNYVSVR